MTSIVIVNWNSGPHLENCVRSLLAHAPESPMIVVDNASTDSSLRFADALGGRLQVIANGANIGFAAANNRGWRATHSERVLFLNPDTECLPGALRQLEQTLNSDRSLWAAGGQLVDPAGKPQTGFNVRAFPSIGSVAAELLFADEIWPSNPWSGPNHFPANSPERDVDQPAAACLMVQRSALEATGGFDEAFYPAWFEDVDFCFRIHRLGGRIRYQPLARFLHHGGYSLGQISRQDFLETFHRNQIRYFKKHHGFKAAARVKKLVLFGLTLRSLVSILYPLAPGQTRFESAKTFRRATHTLSGLDEASL